MISLILAAGYATRLYPLSEQTPKALFEIGGVPLVEQIVRKITAVTDDPLWLITNSKFYRQFAQWGKTFKERKIRIIDDQTTNEQERRGAVGDIHLFVAEKKIAEDLLVVGGDNLFDWSLEGFLNYARGLGPYPVIGLYDVKRKEKAGRFGVVELDASGRITGFQEKPAHPQSSLVSMCLYFFPAATLSFLNDYMEKNNPDASGEYIRWLLNRTPVYGWRFSGKWFDIGDKETLEEAQTKFRR